MGINAWFRIVILKKNGFTWDDQQNMQCINCGFASNKKYKGEIGDILENYPKDFINACKEVNGRWWIPFIKLRIISYHQR